jgi:outer membrane lipase/esterase
MPAYTKAAFQSNGKKARNYAVGGARATDYQGRVNLPQQLLAFLDDVKGMAPADALYVIEMGNNDVRDALVEFSTVYYTALMQGKTEQEAQGEAQAAAGVVIGNALNGIAEHMQMLHYYGARKFLVWTAARIDLTPAVQGMGPETVYIAGMLTDGFNAGLADTLGMLSDPLLGLPEVQIVPLDVSTLMLNVIASPANFGLANVTDPCVKPDTPPFVCKKPNTYFFWDGIHPTKVVHSMIRQLAETALAAYPSP